MKVKIRTWKVMKEVFGLNLCGSIACDETFTLPMEEEMPPDRIIDVIDGHWSGYSISDDMIEYKLKEVDVRTVAPADVDRKSTEEDMVNHPRHYATHESRIECIEIRRELPSDLADAFKYVWRCDDKGDAAENLEKGLWYLEDFREHPTQHFDELVQSKLLVMLDIYSRFEADGKKVHALTLIVLLWGDYSEAPELLIRAMIEERR